MPRQRVPAPYPPEFRAAAIRLARSGDRTLPEIAKDLGAPSNSRQHLPVLTRMRTNTMLALSIVGWGLSMLGLIIRVAIAFWSARVARRKGRSWLLFFIFSLFFFAPRSSWPTSYAIARGGERLVIGKRSRSWR